MGGTTRIEVLNLGDLRDQLLFTDIDIASVDLLNQDVLRSHRVGSVEDGTPIDLRQELLNPEFVQRNATLIEGYQDARARQIANNFMGARPKSNRVLPLLLEQDPSNIDPCFVQLTGNEPDLPDSVARQIRDNGKVIYRFDETRMSDAMRERISTTREYVLHRARGYVGGQFYHYTQTGGDLVISDNPFSNKVDDMRTLNMDMINEWAGRPAHGHPEVSNFDKFIASQREVTPISDLGNGYGLYRLDGEMALALEGERMNHCVGGPVYAKEVGRGSMQIYSIRDANGLPHVTFHVQNGAVHQIRGNSNSVPEGRYLDQACRVIDEQNWRVSGDNWVFRDVNGRVHRFDNIPPNTVCNEFIVGMSNLREMPDLSNLTVERHLNISQNADLVIPEGGMPKLGPNARVSTRGTYFFVQDGTLYDLRQLPEGFVIKRNINLSNMDLGRAPDLSHVTIEGELNLSYSKNLSVSVDQMPKLGANGSFNTRGTCLFEQGGELYDLRQLPKGFVVQSDLDLSHMESTDFPDLSNAVIDGKLNLSRQELRISPDRMPQLGANAQLDISDTCFFVQDGNLYDLHSLPEGFVIKTDIDLSNIYEWNFPNLSHVTVDGNFIVNDLRKDIDVSLMPKLGANGSLNARGTYFFAQDGKIHDLRHLPEGFVIKTDIDLSHMGLGDFPDLSHVTIEGKLDLSYSKNLPVSVDQMPQLGANGSLNTRGTCLFEQGGELYDLRHLPKGFVIKTDIDLSHTYVGDFLDLSNAVIDGNLNLRNQCALRIPPDRMPQLGANAHLDLRDTCFFVQDGNLYDLHSLPEGFVIKTDIDLSNIRKWNFPNLSHVTVDGNFIVNDLSRDIDVSLMPQLGANAHVDARGTYFFAQDGKIHDLRQLPEGFVIKTDIDLSHMDLSDFQMQLHAPAGAPSPQPHAPQQPMAAMREDIPMPGAQMQPHAPAGAEAHQEIQPDDPAGRRKKSNSRWGACIERNGQNAKGQNKDGQGGPDASARLRGASDPSRPHLSRGQEAGANPDRNRGISRLGTMVSRIFGRRK